MKMTILLGLVGCHFVADFYTLVMPAFLPSFMEDFRLNYFEAGVVAFASTILSAFFQPIAGYLTDLYNKRKAGIIMGFSLTAVCTFLLGLVPNYFLLIVVCLMMGLGLSVYHPQSTNFLIMYFRESKGKAMGIHGLGGSLGIFAAPLIVGFLISIIGWEKGAFVLSIPPILTVFLVWHLLDEPELPGGKGFFQGVTPVLVLLGMVYGLNGAVHRGFVSFLPAFYVNEGQTIFRAGLLTSSMLGAGLLAQPIGGLLFDRIGGRKTLLFSLSLSPLAIFGFSQAQGMLKLVFSVCVGFFTLLVLPVGLVYASQLVARERVGSSVGLVFGCSMAFGSVTPILMGHLIDSAGFYSAYLSLAVLAVIGASLAYLLPKAYGE